MPAAKKPIPEGYHSITPVLIAHDAAAALAWYAKAFGAKELMRFPSPKGKIAHAEIEIGDSRVMIADEFPEMGAKSPKTVGGSPATMHLYLPDADAGVARAVDAGAKVVRPVKDQFYGDRSGTIEDPFGYVWHVATHKEDVPEAELKRRAEAAFKEMGGH